MPEQLEVFATLSPRQLPTPPPDVSNRYADDPNAALLGQRLYFDTSLSGELLDGDNDGSAATLGKRGETNKVACAGCHIPSASFSDDRSPSQQLSLAAGWGMRRTPSLLDIGQSRILMWDGRHDSFHSQVFGVIESPVELNSSRLFVAQRIFAAYKADYERVFAEPLPPLHDTQRFPSLAANQTGCRKLTPDNACAGPMRGAPGDGAEYDHLTPADRDAVTRVVVNVAKALGAYQRLLTCGPSRFDAWVNGDEAALSDAEARGAYLFIGRAHCVSCHSGPYFSDEQFHNVGLMPQVVSVVFVDTNDAGAHAGIAALLADPLNTAGVYSDGDDGRVPALEARLQGAFRTPHLRCVSGRPSYMHTAQLRSLKSVVEFFDRGGDQFGYPGTNELSPLQLTVEEKSDLVSFLRALDGPGPARALVSAP